ncbi:serine/threonine-protein kinase [Nodularia harveyana UHCC-0300]|uniref:Serine/threonine-protein kinase n=1 Tax=Nodularia harveyana UHCC-0300 TaxID=2974287 RepID=A0ABU5UGV5_9CYAN|nr:serine/threonine-protein kinase [Nodularia harveyana]MEA5582787.1 serine/threonine-protein kinase [Nodularia harveyana UHCC-0300]
MFKSGQILQERYQLQQQLGHTMAGRQTWLAEDLNHVSHELVILKLLVFNTEFKWDDLKLFEREAQVLQNLNHERIPRYRDYFLVDKEPNAGLSWWCLVQNYIPGSTLQDLLAEGIKFSESELKQIAGEILQILIYLHHLNPPVLHRDIKPSNLIQGEDKHIYLVDFGAVQDRMAVTKATFTVVGTIGYTPMEQFWGRAVPASDLYGLGATLIHLVTGVAPADLPQKNLRIQFASHASISANFVSWIQKLTEPDLEERFSTANEAFEVFSQGFKSRISQKKSLPNQKSIYLTRPFLVVTKNSPEELEIFRYKESNNYQRLIILIPVLLILSRIFGSLIVGGLILLLFFSFRSKILDVAMNEKIDLFLANPLAKKTSLMSENDYGGYLYFNSTEKSFRFQNVWFAQFQSRVDFIKNIRSIYVCQRQDNRANQFFQTDISQKWEVVIRTESDRIRLNWRLNEEECAWLVDEIQTWLNNY